jgi:murein DD-endopeptidase MepM/ murein hydrolase activator NlpD
MSLSSLLLRHQADFGPIMPVDLSADNVTKLDLTDNNQQLAHADLCDTAAFEVVVNAMLAEQHATIGVGGYLENRVIYRRSQHFAGAVEEARSLHLGVDVWIAAGTPILAPLPGRVHGLANNAHFGDYGITVVLRHELEGTIFYTLYGHLARLEWSSLSVGQEIAKGQAFAAVGPYPENGDWPPHLHFQVIADMQGRVGDFPGVARPSERDIWAELCPDPNIILQSAKLPTALD